MIKKTKLEKKLKYIKINRKDYYHLLKKVTLLTNNNKILIEQNENYKKEIIELKYELDNYSKNTLKDNNMEYLNYENYKNYNNNIYTNTNESSESELEDMEDELYEENVGTNSNVNNDNKYENCEGEYDNHSITSNTSNHSTEKSNNSDKDRKKYIKIDNDEENLKVINRLRKNNINLNKYRDDGSLFNDIMTNNRNTLKLFHDLYIKIKDNVISNDIYEIYDKNKSRFMKNLEISFKIFNNSKIVDSNLIFPLYTFNSVKKTSVDNFIKLIEEMILKNM